MTGSSACRPGPASRARPASPTSWTRASTFATSRVSSTPRASSWTSSSSAGARATSRNNLEKKIALYRSFETPVVCGGTLFEAVYARDRIDEFKQWLTEHRFSHVEISDGTLDIPRERKLELIADFARDFTVLSEVGSKDSDVVFAPYQWVAWIKEELEAGAWKVITEGREGGTSGIFRPDGDMRTGLLDEIAHEIAVESLLFEAPTKSSQAWFVQQFGSNVNLGNIPPDEVIPLETLRLGLRADTLKEILLATPAAD